MTDLIKQWAHMWGNRIRFSGILLALFVAGTSTTTGEPVSAIAALKPLACWPADEGQGTVVHDRFGQGLDATAYHVPWRDGQLAFTSAFQWVELPGQADLLTSQFTIACWVYNRSDVYLKGGAVVMAFLKPTRQWEAPNLHIKLREGSLLEVSVDNGEDTLGTRDAKVRLPLNQWQHVAYTYDNGTATLFVNGLAVATKDGVPFAYQANRVLQFGGCGSSWQVYPSRTESFCGSLGGMALFDRALEKEAVKQLLAATRPAKTPVAFDTDAIVINGSMVNDNSIPDGGFVAGPVVFEGEQVVPGTLATKPMAYRYRLLENLARHRGPRQIRPTTLWLADLVAALDDWQTQYLAAKLLVAMHDDQASDALTAALPQWLTLLSDPAVSPEARTAAALSMAELGHRAKVAIPTLTTLIAAGGDTIPRVDEILRNGAIYALRRIDRNHPALATLANPTDAAYFSQGDLWRDSREPGSHTRAYSPKCEHDGVIYSIGEGISPNVAEPISQEDFAKAIASLAKEYPQASEWRKLDSPNLFRLKINKIHPDGRTESAYLVGDDFVFDGTDGKMRGWSIAVDSEGFVHVIGGQHNYPSTKNFISGSFLRMGFSEGTRRDGKHHPTDPLGYDPKYPAHMYWVSKTPGDITDFEFVGAFESPRKITWAECVNYMNFIQDNEGVLYAYFRTASVGFHSLGAHRYDAKAQRWSPVGAPPIALMAAARQENPAWYQRCIRSIRNGIPGPREYEALTWAWQPGFYNYMRSSFGIQFDRTNRMHVQMEMRGMVDDARIIDANVYAYSDDGGRTFHRADGSPVQLPLTINPIADYNADITISPVGSYWMIWRDNLKHAGYLK